MNRVEDIVAAVETLPPLPDTTVRLLAVIRDPRSSMDEIVSVIKYDEVLTGEVLKLCNSAYFGLNRKIHSLNDAMVCLGTAKLLHLVMAAHSNALLGHEQQGYGMLKGQLWQHSVGVALACEAIGTKTKQPNTNLLFTAGLIHDIGKVVLNQYVGKEYAEIARLVTEEKRAFNEAERMVLGYDHCEVGALLAEKWNLSEVITQCIRWHHEPAAYATGSVQDAVGVHVDMVYLADILCLMLGLGLGSDGMCYRADEQILERYGLAERDLEMIGAQVTGELIQVKHLSAES